MMPRLSADGKFSHCSICNQKFRFQYEALKHEQEQHPNSL